MTQNFVIEIELPDGYHWFAGFGNHPEAEKRGLHMPMNVWTPYPEEALRMDDEQKALEVNSKLLDDAQGIVTKEEDAKFILGYRKQADGNYLGPKRICYLQLGESFKLLPESDEVFKAVQYIEDKTKVVCICLTSKTVQSVVRSLKSRRFVYVIYKPISLNQNNN